MLHISFPVFGDGLGVGKGEDLALSFIHLSIYDYKFYYLKIIYRVRNLKFARNVKFATPKNLY